MLSFFTITSRLGAVCASIGAALFWSVHKGWLEVGVFSKMTSEQTFQAFIWSISGAFILAIIGFVVYVLEKRKPEKYITASDHSIAIDNSGKDNSINIKKLEVVKNDWR